MPHPVKYPALPIRYSFYSESGDGRDTFIMSQSRNPTSFVYVPKAPVMAVNLQTGMGSSIPGNLKQPPGEAAAIGVPGYTGHVPGASYATGDTFARSSADAIATFRGNVKNGFPEQAPHFPSVWPRAPPMKTEEYAKSQALQSTRAAQPGFRIPGYSGHSSGHQHVAGKTYGTICSGEAGERSGAVITEGAPGLGRKEVMAVQVNLQPDAPPRQPCATPPCRAAANRRPPRRHRRRRRRQSRHPNHASFSWAHAAPGNLRSRRWSSTRCRRTRRSSSSRRTRL